MSTLQRIGMVFGAMSGTIIAFIGFDMTWDAIASGELIGAFIVFAFVTLPGMAASAGVGIAMYLEDREDRRNPAPGTYRGECVGGWHCGCADCIEYRHGVRLPD